MPAPIGALFAPTFDNASELGRSGSPASAQSSLQTLNFQLKKPRVVGAAQNGLSPQQGSQQAGSSISSAVLQSVLRTVLGAEAAGFTGDQEASAYLAGAPMSSPSRPAPVIHPGGEGVGPKIPTGDEPSTRTPMGDLGGTPRQPTPEGGLMDVGPYGDFINQERLMNRYRSPNFTVPVTDR